MSAEATPPVQSSAGVLRISVLIKDVIAALTSSKQSFAKHQDIVRELLSLDRVVLEVALSAENYFLFTLKDKAAPTIEQTRHELVTFLDKCERDPAFGDVRCPQLYATDVPGDSDSRREPNDIEDFRSAVSKFSTDLNTLLTLESKPYPLEFLKSSSKNLHLENQQCSFPSTSSLDLGDNDELQYVQPTQIHANDFMSGRTCSLESVIHDQSPEKNVLEDTDLIEDSPIEDVWSSPPFISSLDVEDNDILTPMTKSKDHLAHTRMSPAQRSVQSATIDLPNSARDHPLYENVTNGSDGLYHCPWEGKDPLCSHKPRREKCYYFKFVDAHLKPYRCEVKECKNRQFSSISILNRHQQEAHGIRGINKGLYLCPAPDCGRGCLDKGFSRYWNLVDHMRRVHNCSPEAYKIKPLPRGTSKYDGTLSSFLAEKETFLTLLDTEKVSALPSMDLFAIKSEFRAEQPKSKLSPSVEPLTRPNSSLERLDDDPAYHPADQPVCMSIDQSQGQTYHHASQSPIQNMSNERVQLWQADPDLANNTSSGVQESPEYPLVGSVSAVDISELGNKRHQNTPQLPQCDTSEDGLPAKKPRYTRSKNGCYTCRKRKTKCDEIQPRCGTCIKSRRECQWPDSSFVISYSAAGTESKQVSAQESIFSHTISSSPIAPQQQPPSRWTAKSCEDGALTTESLSDPHQEKAAGNLRQCDADAMIDDSDARLLYLLRASLQDS